MPLYQYQCKTCGEVFEKRMRWSEADRQPVCPRCQSPDTKRKLAAEPADRAAETEGGRLERRFR